MDESEIAKEQSICAKSEWASFWGEVNSSEPLRVRMMPL
jgi:hypothetical protein